MNTRLVRLGPILILSLAILLMAPMAGMAFENSMLDVSLAPPSQAEPTSTPTARQGSRYSQYISRKNAQTPTPAATLTPAPVDTPAPDSVSQPEGVTSLRSTVLVDGSRLNRVIGDRLSSSLYGFGSAGDLFRSEDDGVTWELLAGSSEVTDFVVSPADSMVLYGGQGLDCNVDGVTSEVVDPAPLLRSDNGGVSWEELALGDNLVPLLAHPQEADTLLTADCELPYLSDNGGDSWQSKPDSSPAALWDSYRMNEVAVSSLVGQSSVDTANWNYLYASGTGEDGTGVVAYSGDIGDNWERITPRISPQPRGISAIAADPTTAGRLWFTDRNGIWYTDDFGVSWQLTILGLEDVLNAGDKLDVTGLTDIVYLPNGDVYVATIEGLYRGKPDSGIWMLVEDGEFETSAIKSLLVTESQPGVLWVNAEDGVYLYSVQ